MENENVNNISQEDSSGLSFGDILLLIRKYIIAIIAFIVVFSVAGFGLAKYKDTKSPRYTANSSMVVSLPSDSTLALTTQYQLAYYMTTTFVDFISEDPVLEPVAEEYNVSLSTIKSNLSVSHNEDSLILYLFYVSSSRESAANILNSIMESVEEVAKTPKEDSSEEAKYPLLANNISTFAKAESNKASKSSSTIKYTILFFAVGVVAAVIYVFIRELLDNSFKSKEDIEKELGIQVISIIPYYQLSDYSDIKEIDLTITDGSTSSNEGENK